MWDGFEEEWNEEDASGLSVHPIKDKANAIVRLSYALAGNLDEAHSKLYGETMIQDAKKIGVCFDQAQSEKDYILKMENAVLVKVHARSLSTISSQLSGQGSLAKEHEKLLQDAILELRPIYKEWIQSFDSSEATDDGWGIFTGQS